MSEPVSSGAAGLAGWKLIGGLATVLAIGAGLAAIVVMCMTPPRHAREWAVGLISTVLGSIAGGAAAVQYLGLTDWAQSYFGLIAILGIVFACGLPAWTIVRAVFTYLDKQKDKDIVQIAKDLKDEVKS